jgi:hypothetical protein
MKYSCHRIYIVKNETIGDQMIVFDELALLCSVVLRYNSIAAETHPLCEAIERLAFIGKSAP